MRHTPRLERFLTTVLVAIPCAVPGCGERNTEQPPARPVAESRDFSERCGPSALAAGTQYRASGKSLVPFQAVAKLTLSRGEICSGVVVSSTHLLTAAHCFEEGGGVESLSFSDSPERTGGRPQVESVTLHPEYERRLGEGMTLNAHPEMASFDIAVVRLKTLDSSLTPVPLGAAPQVEEGNLVSLIGFGDTGEGPGRKRLAQSHYWRAVNQENVLGNPFSNLFLLDSKSGSGACPGDSGGGVFRKNANGELVLIGLVQGVNDLLYPGFPASTCSRCPAGLGIVTSLEAHKGFLAEAGVDTSGL